MCWLVGLIGFLTAWQMLGVEEMFAEVFTHKELKDRYDYIIGRHLRHHVGTSSPACCCCCLLLLQLMKDYFVEMLLK